MFLHPQEQLQLVKDLGFVIGAGVHSLIGIKYSEVRTISDNGLVSTIRNSLVKAMPRLKVISY